MASTVLRPLTFVLAVLLTIVSYFGAFVANTYEREVASMAAQGMGQDIIDLFLVVPVLIISLVFMQKNNKTAIFIFGGTVFYILYSFVIYSLGIHFNNLFLLYCFTFGCSLYLFILYLFHLNGLEVKSWFEDKTPIRLIGIYLIVISAMFYFLWLKDIIPAILNNSIPKSVSDYDLLVNPVHVIDLAVALPGLVITSILLMKRNNLGYIFAPIFLVFTIILVIALVAMMFMLKMKNISDDASVAGIFIILAIISSIFLFIYLSKIKKGHKTTIPDK